MVFRSDVTEKPFSPRREDAKKDRRLSGPEGRVGLG
jgi:hypothetical protein